MNRIRNLCILLTAILVILLCYPFVARFHSIYVTRTRLSRTAVAASSNFSAVIEPWLISKRPYLEQFPTNLPHIIDPSIVYYSEQGCPQDVFASVQYTVLINSNDLALRLNYRLSLNEMGFPLDVHDESATVVSTAPSGSIAEGWIAEHLSRAAATTGAFNHYYGATVALTNLPSYMTVLRDGGVLPQLEAQVQDGERLVSSTRRTKDDILKLMSQQVESTVPVKAAPSAPSTVR